MKQKISDLFDNAFFVILKIVVIVFAVDLVVMMTAASIATLAAGSCK